MLTQAPPAVPRRAPRAGEPADDMSGRAHRQAIGYSGLALPVVLVLIDRWRPYADGAPWFRDSISAYYYTGATAAFVGLLVTLGLFLFTYRGYDNKYAKADRAAALIASIAAFGVAFFPMGTPPGFADLPWWRSWIGVVHYTAACVLFGAFAVFSLWLFRLTSGGELPSPEKRWRNRIHLLCGLVIVVALAWAFVARRRGQDIFWPESLALVAFATSWLVKGRAVASIVETTRAIAGKKSPALPGQTGGAPADDANRGAGGILAPRA